MKKINHPHREGYLLKFGGGRVYSVIDLSSTVGMIEPDAPAEVVEIAERMMTNAGKLYDGMGGHYEGILLPGKHPLLFWKQWGWGDPIRGRSFDEVINEIKKLEGVYER